MKVWFRKHRHGIQKAVFIFGIVVAVAVIALGFADATINKRVMENYTIDVLYLAVVWLWCVVIVGYTFIRRYNKTCDTPKIYTHNVAAKLIDLLEDVLDKNDITSPDEEREGNEDEARIYGKVYSDLLDDVENELVDLLNKHKDGFTIVTDVFE